MEPYVIFVGSRAAGRLAHLNRIMRREPNRYEPVTTITTCEQRPQWYQSWFTWMDRLEVRRTFASDKYLTFFEEGDHHFYILNAEVERVRIHGKVPLMGMTPIGLERLRTRKGAVHDLTFTAIVLQPEDPERFRETLVRDHGLPETTAQEEVDRAVRLSTVPPAPCPERSSIIPVRITGTPADDEAVDDALRSIRPPSF